MIPFGFHTGPNGNLNGIGDHWRALDAARIPAFLKSTDYFGPCFELANLAAASGVPHTIIYRLSTKGQNSGVQYDVPDYSLSPFVAASKHWQNTWAKLPPEFDKGRVWVEPINEVDKNRAEWLGQFAVEFAKLANGQGYKVTMFGWSSGEPEIAHWQTPGMLAYLRYCAANPGKAAVSLHEYSFDVDDILDGYPHKIGRFTQLLTVCQQNNIAPPEIHLTEWGWTYRNVPSPIEAIVDLETVYGVYSPYPTVKGAAIWNLGGGDEWGDIHNQTQRLIVPVTQFNLDHAGEVPPPQPPTGYKSVVFKLAQEHTVDEWAGIARLAHQEYKRTLTASGDNCVVMVGDGNAESYAVVFDPDLPSQVATIQQLTAAGLNYQTRTYRQPPPTNPQIQVTPISQRDPRWANVDMGGDGKTIGNWGCLLVTYLIHAKHWKLCNDDPPAFMTRLKAAGAMSGPYLLPAALRTVFPDRVKYLGYEGRGDNLNTRIRASIDRGIPVPARVDFNPATGQWEQHWVLITGHTANDFIMADPWYGDIAPLSSRYNISGNDVLEGIFYELLPVQPPTQTIDLLPYIKGDGRLYEVRTVGAGQERFQTQSSGSVFWQTKNASFEELAYDATHIWRGLDISPGPAPVYAERPGVLRYYTAKEPNMIRARWCKRNMAIGETFTGSGHHVQFYYQDTCQPSGANSGPATNKTKLVAKHASKTWNGIMVNDVVEMTNGIETWFFARGYGLVAWNDDKASSAISEIHAPGTRPDNIRATGCWS